MALGFMLLLIWQQWQMDYVVPQQATVSSPQSTNTGSASTSANSADVPSASINLTVNPDQQLKSAESVTVTTDLFKVVFNTAGADPRSVELLQYPVSLEEPNEKLRLMSEDPARFFVPQIGLKGGSEGSEAPDHHAIYQVAATEFNLKEGSDELVVPFTWTTDSGVTITKAFVFQRDSYEIGVRYTIDNQSSDAWSGVQYQQLQRKGVTDDETQSFIYTYIGGVFSSPEEVYEKIDFDDVAEGSIKKEITDGWLAVIQHYFAAAMIPTPGETYTYYTNKLSGQSRYIWGAYSGKKTVAPGESGQFQSAMYIGPKIQDRMESAATNLRLTVDYGYLTFLAQPMFWLLHKIHSFLGNWGWSIIVLTLMIKAVFYKLSESSYRSMAKMRKLAPKLQKLKESYGDDRQKMGQATMELYKKEKVNPLGGCLPMLIQIPFFIALYWVLLESVELRQAPWILWIKDLAVQDPYYILPLLMGATMFIQQRLNPPPPDPVQAKVFMFMPVIFTVFFMFFPAGLVLYWTVNNTITIIQQYIITRHVLAEDKN